MWNKLVTLPVSPHILTLLASIMMDGIYYAWLTPIWIVTFTQTSGYSAKFTLWKYSGCGFPLIQPNER